MRTLVALLLGAALVSCVAPDVAASPTPSPDIASAPPTGPALTGPLMTPAVPDPTQVRATLPPIEPRYATQVVVADFDCDGARDRLDVTHDGGDSPIWHVTLTLASGDVARTDLTARPLTAFVLGTPDVDLDGCADAVVQIGNGASTTWLAFLTYHAGVLSEITNGDPYGSFLIGGSVRHGDSIDCRRGPYGAELVWRSTSDYTNELQWDVVERVYRWPVPGTLALAYITRFDIRVGHAYEPPPEHGRLWGFNCGRLSP